MRSDCKKKNLLEKIAHFENLSLAFKECSRGKRGSLGYQESLFAIGERLKGIEHQLLANKFEWKGYRSFYVHDPKTRIVMSAPFMDRVVHHAIHRLVEPIIDPLLSDSVFACRKGMGNRNAAISLFKALEYLGKNRFAIKLDVKKYFQSIDHFVLHKEFMEKLPDNSLSPLVWKLLKSHDDFAKQGQGIPIGNLTSQLFANFYLSSADRVATDELGIDYYWSKKSILLDDFFYIRYMDDLVLVGKEKSRVLKAAKEVIDHIQGYLKLQIPINKRVPLGNAPIPFMGYVLDHKGVRILSRNQRRFNKKIYRLKKKKAKPSYIAQVETSFKAWKRLEVRVS